ncbi:MAG: ABC transporter permease [Chloroflexi bacterium]|nr:ABC transporter permease [Chloroflexota bacterium]
MIRFLLRRLAFFVLTLFLTSLLIFALTRVLPGDVAQVILGREATDAALEATREELGLNEPLLVQYVDWAASFFTGDLGQTFSSPRRDINELLGARVLNSGRLAALTLLLAVPLAVTLGVVAGLSEGKFADGLISILSLSVVSLPEFVTGLFLINVVALGMRQLPIIQSLDWWFPASSSINPNATFSEALPFLWLPAITATLVLLAYVIRLVRAGVIEELKKDYVNTATLKGIPRRRVVFNHVLRNALIPTVTVIATSTGWLLSGLVVIEFVFNYPGLGRLLIFAINNRDLPLVQAIVMVTVVIILIANFTADILYAVLNPRIKLA